MRDSTFRQAPSRAESHGTTTAVSRSGPDSDGAKLLTEYDTPCGTVRRRRAARAPSAVSGNS
jgi:hypothetical protein